MGKNLSALKALRQSKKRYLYNKRIKQNINFLERKFRKAFLTKNIEEVKIFCRSLQKALDKAKQKGILKKNTVNRKKSCLARKLNNLLKQTKD